jgi:hypothetical protein
MTAVLEPGPSRPGAPRDQPFTAAGSTTLGAPVGHGAQDPSLAHLFGRLAAVEARVAALVRGQRSGDPNPADPFRGLYVSDDQAEALLEAGRGAPVAPGSDDGGRAPVEGAADEAEAAGAEIRLRSVELAFGLDPLDVELLLVAMAPDLDPRFERLYGYLNDDVSRRRASIGLALRLCGVDPWDGAGRARFNANAPLVAGGLLLVEADRPFLGRALTAPDRLVAHLLGDGAPDPAVASLLVPRPAGCTMDAGGGPASLAEATLERGLRSGVRLAYLREFTGSDGVSAARQALERSGRVPLVLDLRMVAPADDLSRVTDAAVREARLHGGGLVAAPVEVLAERGPGFVRQLADAPCPVVLLGSRGWDPMWSRSLPLLLEAPLATRAQRDVAWRSELGDAPGVDAAVEAIGSYPFRLGSGQVARAAASARWQAAARGGPVTTDDLAAGVRAQNAAGLERLARRITPHASWPDLVLPPDIVAQLRDLASRARYRDAVLDGWRLGDPNRGRGLTALFTGDSGTGKTLSAEVVASELGLDVYVIDLSTVVDKYIGETEKNLDRVFGEADGVNGILLFDEADAIFGKRSEVKDARDRYANVEIAYLLQRMERFDGLAILTTNLRSNLDEAFTRRLDVLIDFPVPDEPERRRLWARHLVPSLPVTDDIDIDFLAARFRLAGGSVRNVVLAAAYLAAAEDRPVTMADMIRGTGSEYRKLGHLATEAEFGPYFGLLAP